MISDFGLGISDTAAYRQSGIRNPKEGFLPGGSIKNKEYLEGDVAIDPGIPEEVSDLLFDAQTSGGMLVCAPEGAAGALLEEIREGGDPEAMEVGEVLPREDVSIRLVE